MASKKEQIETEKRRPWWRRLLVFLLLWTYRIVGTATIIAAVFVLIAQTEAFRDWFKGLALDYVNSEIQGEFLADDIRIDLFRGIVIDNPSLSAEGKLVFSAKEVSVSYDLAGLFERVAAVNRLNIVDPEIVLDRDTNGVWNLDKILKSAGPESPPSDPPDGTLLVRSFSIENGRVSINDRTAEPNDGTQFDPLHLELDDLDLHLSVRAQLYEHDIMAAVNGMSFTHVNGPLDLERFQAVVHATPKGLDVSSLHFELPGTDVFARAKIENIDLFDGFSDSLLLEHPIVGHITSEELLGSHLHYFVPDVDLAGSYSIDVDASFDGNELITRNLSLHAGDANVYGRVRINELAGNAPIEVDIELHGTSARYADIRRRIKFVPLPDLPFLQRARLDHLKMRGHPDDSLWFHVVGGDRLGKVDAELSLYFDQPVLAYQMEAAISSGDLSGFDEEDGIKSNLNGRVMMVGSGVTLQELKGTTQIELDRSTLMGRQIKSFRAIIQGDGRGHISVDTLFADVTPFKLDTIVEEDELALESNTTGARETVGLSGILNAKDPDWPKYSGQLNVVALNVSRLFNDSNLPERFSTNLSFDIAGINIDEIVGQVEGKVQSLAMDDRAMMPFDVSVVSEHAKAVRSLAIETSFGHAYINGDFKPSELTDVLSTSVSAIGTAIDRRINKILGVDTQSEAHPVSIAPFQAHIDIDLLEVSPLNLLLQGAYISGQARLDARMYSYEDVVEIDLDSLYVQDFILKGDSLNIVADPTYLAGSAKINSLAIEPRLESITVHGTSDSLLIVNDLYLRSPDIDVMSKNGVISVSASSGINEMGFSVLGTMTEPDDQTLEVALDSLSFTLDPTQDLRWMQIEKSNITLSKRRTEVRGLHLIRPNGEDIVVNGVISDSLFENATAEISNFPLRDIRKFANVSGDNPLALIDGLVTKAVVKLGGTWLEPEIDVEIDAEQVAYNRALIGTLHTKMSHRDKNISGTAQIDDKRKSDIVRALNLDVRSLPFDLAFADVEDRVVPDREIDISLQASDLAMAAIEPFLPSVESVRGRADASMTVKGTTPSDIDLQGNASFNGVKFLASPTNIVYRASGDIHLSGTTLFLDSVLIQNEAQDLKRGVGLATGVVEFDGLAVDSVDIQIETPSKSGIKILNTASQARSPTVYGDLIIRSGNNPIRLYGRLDEPHLVGDMIVARSDIIFPQERSTTKARKSSFVYHRMDPTRYDQRSIFDYISDTTEAVPDTARVEYVSEGGDEADKVVNAVRELVDAEEGDFVNDLVFDLDIYLRGRTLLTMNFGTFEILIADLEQVDRQLPLNFSGKFGDESIELAGTVRVKEGTSQYTFYKPFRTSGELNFSSGGMTNPDLKLKAVHEDHRIVGDGRREDYKVELTITGTKKKPNISYRIWRNNREVVGDSAKIAGDAIMLIIAGRTQDELFESGQGDLVGNINSSMSALATSALSDIVSGIGVIQSAQLDVGSDISDSRLTVSGQVFGDVTYRVSGQISDFSGNSTFTLSMPLSVLYDEEALRYLRADFSHTVNNTGNVTRQTRLWEIKLGARLP